MKEPVPISPLFVFGSILEESPGLRRFWRFHFTDDLEAGNTHEVFRVVRDERNGVTKRAGSDPEIVRGNVASNFQHLRLDLSELSAEIEIVWHDDGGFDSLLEVRDLPRAPTPSHAPREEFADGDERQGDRFPLYGGL